MPEQTAGTMEGGETKGVGPTGGENRARTGMECSFARPGMIARVED